MSDRERDIEAYLQRKLTGMGCLFLKWVCPGNAGVPDRILILPRGKVIFVEIKAESGRMTCLQDSWQQRLREMGCSAVTIYGRDAAEELVTLVQDCLGLAEGKGLVPQ